MANLAISIPFSVKFALEDALLASEELFSTATPVISIIVIITISTTRLTFVIEVVLMDSMPIQPVSPVFSVALNV